MTDAGSRQFRSAFGWRSVDGAATEESLEVEVDVFEDGAVCGMVDDVLPVLVDGVVAGEVAFELRVESAGRAAGSLVDCA